jgi:flagellar basal-body rod protein FlgB
MSFFNLDLLGVALQRMRHSAARETVIAQNIAQADTPGRRARDLAAFDFGAELARVRNVEGGGGASDPSHLRLTRAGHRAASGRTDFATSERASSWEILPGGNAVSLEQQMLAMTETKLMHDQAVAYYRKAVELLKAASSGRF